MADTMQELRARIRAALEAEGASEEQIETALARAVAMFGVPNLDPTPETRAEEEALVDRYVSQAVDMFRQDRSKVESESPADPPSSPVDNRKIETGKATDQELEAASTMLGTEVVRMGPMGIGAWAWGDSGAFFGLRPGSINWQEFVEYAIDQGFNVELQYNVESVSGPSFGVPGTVNWLETAEQIMAIESDWSKAIVQGFAIEMDWENPVNNMYQNIPLPTISTYRDAFGMSNKQAYEKANTAQAHGYKGVDGARLYALLMDNDVELYRPSKFVGRAPATTVDKRRGESESYRKERGRADEETWLAREGEKSANRSDTWGGYLDRHKAAMAKFNHGVIADVAMFDPQLALRLYNDPYSLSVEELRKALKYTSEPEEYDSADAIGAAWLADRLMGGGESTVQVDKEGARAAARTLAASWNLPVTDAVVESIVNAVSSGAAAAAKRSLGNPFKPDLSGGGVRVVDSPGPYSAAAKGLRGTDAYRDLFRHFDLGGGETEEQFAGRFSTAASSVLGPGADTLEAAQVGMRTNDPNQVASNVLMTGKGETSSTFMGRLARLGKAFQAGT